MGLDYLHVSLRGLFNAKAILVEGHQWCYTNHGFGENKGFQSFSKGINLKVKLIALRRFELMMM